MLGPNILTSTTSEVHALAMAIHPDCYHMKEYHDPCSNSSLTCQTFRAPRAPPLKLESWSLSLHSCLKHSFQYIRFFF